MSPDRLRECQLAQEWGTVAGMDEVGRGALAGPVCVGAVVVAANMPEPPEGIADSKLLSPARRENLVTPIKTWALGWGVGMASSAEVDAYGLTVALRMAGMRALEECGTVGGVLLDGSHDWLSGGSLFEEVVCPYPVVTEVKGDLRCLAIAAASILAKVARDSLMEHLPDPGYDWAKNKGYGSPSHKKALGELGVSEHHRRSWKLM